MAVGGVHLLLTRGKQPRVPSLLTIIAPRSRSRCLVVKRQLQDLGLHVRLLSQTPSCLPRDQLDVLVVDEAHQLALLYAATDIVFVGNSLFEGGRGHSLADVAVCGCTILTGHHLAHYQQMADELNAAALEESKSLEERLGGRGPDPAPLLMIDPCGRPRVAGNRPSSSASTTSTSSSSSSSSSSPGAADSYSPRASVSSIPRTRPPPGPSVMRPDSIPEHGPSESVSPPNGISCKVSVKGGTPPLHDCSYDAICCSDESAIAYVEPYSAPPSRFLGHCVMFPHHLRSVPESPAVWQLKNTEELGDALQSLFASPVECFTRGYAAAIGAARLANQLIATLKGSLEDNLLQPMLKQHVSAGPSHL